jgi:hypothetical protein
MRNPDRHDAVDTIRGTKVSWSKDVHHEPVKQPDQIGGPTSGTRVLTPGSKRRPYHHRVQSLPACRNYDNG